MLELGPAAAAMHASLAADLAANGIDLVFAAGPLMKHLFDALPPDLRGAWSERAADMAPVLCESVRAGDIVVVKGSNGSKMSALVGALKEFSNTAATRGG
jgi:UDP-N-acetylmuramoyl-tripeptide--D-alanyl-D-alanine ligase